MYPPCANVIRACHSPLKRDVVEGAGVGKLVEKTRLADATPMDEGTSSGDSAGSVAVYSLWAIKNLVYMADMSVKRGVMGQLTYDSLHRLVMSADLVVKEQALAILRNLLASGQEDVMEAVDGLGRARWLECVLEGLDVPLRETSSAQQQTHAAGILVNAMYAIVNTATGRDEDKLMIMNTPRIVQAVHDNLVSILVRSVLPFADA